MSILLFDLTAVKIKLVTLSEWSIFAAEGTSPAELEWAIFAEK